MQNLVSLPAFERESILPTADSVSGSMTKAIPKASHTESQQHRDRHIRVCGTEGDTNAKTDFIKHTSEHLLLELQLYGFWGSNLKRNICSSGFLYQKADNVPSRYKINIAVCKLAGHLLFILSTIKHILKAKIIQRGNYKNMIPHPHIGTLLSTREISLRTN